MWTGEQSLGLIEHLQSMRGQIRQRLVSAQLLTHLPPPPLRVLDVGAGTGTQGLSLASKGYDVTLCEPDGRLIELADMSLAAMPADIQSRTRLVQASIETLDPHLTGQEFHVVLCHSVLMYVASPRRALNVLRGLMASGGLLSLLEKNGAALALRPGLQGKYSDALEAMDATASLGNLGLVTAGVAVAEGVRLLDRAGCDLEAWYGVRLFSDHFSDADTVDDIEILAALELAASVKDPYRGVARLLHFIGRGR